MSRLPLLFTVLTSMVIVHVLPLADDDDICFEDGVDLTLLDVARLDDAEYARVFGYDRHGAVVLREGETWDDVSDDGWAGDLDPGLGGGDGAGVGGNYE